MRYIFRFICLPFYGVLVAIGLFYQWALLCINFIRYGGEAFSYTKKNQKPMIGDVYNAVKEFIDIVDKKESEDK